METTSPTITKYFNNFCVSYTEHEEYIDVFITEYRVSAKHWFYLYLNGNPQFPFINFERRPSSYKEDEPSSETIYREEYNAYHSRKYMGQPSYKLHRTSFDELIKTLKSLTNQ